MSETKSKDYCPLFAFLFSNPFSLSDGLQRWSYNSKHGQKESIELTDILNKEGFFFFIFFLDIYSQGIIIQLHQHFSPQQNGGGTSLSVKNFIFLMKKI